MTRGILATCYARPRGAVTAAQRLEAAQRAATRASRSSGCCASRRRPQRATGWATGSNLAFLSYAVNAQTGLVVALGAIDNLGKGASAPGRAEREPDDGQPETAGLAGLPLWP